MIFIIVKIYKTEHYEDCKEEIENLFDEDYKENEEIFFKENKEKIKHIIKIKILENR